MAIKEKSELISDLKTRNGRAQKVMPGPGLAISWGKHLLRVAIVVPS